MTVGPASQPAGSCKAGICDRKEEGQTGDEAYEQGVELMSSSTSDDCLLQRRDESLVF